MRSGVKKRAMVLRTVSHGAHARHPCFPTRFCCQFRYSSTTPEMYGRSANCLLSAAVSARSRNHLIRPRLREFIPDFDLSLKMPSHFGCIDLGVMKTNTADRLVCCSAHRAIVIGTLISKLSSMAHIGPQAQALKWAVIAHRKTVANGRRSYKGQMKCARRTHPSGVDQFYDLAT